MTENRESKADRVYKSYEQFRREFYGFEPENAEEYSHEKRVSFGKELARTILKRRDQQPEG